MHPDTQNFSHITDINTSEKLSVYIEFKIFKNPQFTFTVNDIKLTDTINKLKLDLLDDIVLKYTNNGNNSDGAVEIVDLSVNSKHILPLYLHHAIPPTHWIENIDTWEMKIPSPFYAWYQKISGDGWVA
jgi:hypothetical protein